jgi:type II secretory pathway pseudopilin PulG
MGKTWLLLGAGLLAAILPTSAGAMDASRGTASMTCTNTSSGATWQVKLDYDHATADAYPARISETQISWKDASDGGNYTLDRKSGELTVIFASSTGGYFLHHRCKDN